MSNRIFFVGGRNMQLWKYLLDADKANDLSEPESAWTWIQAQRWDVRPEQWTELAKRSWGRMLPVLRSIAVRLSRKRPRRLTPAQVEIYTMEDWFAQEYLNLLQPVAVHKDGSPADGLLFKGTYLKFQPMPTYVAGNFTPQGGVLRRWCEGKPEEYGRDDFQVFWQVVFQGLLMDSAPAVCETCGGAVKGKRQRQCERCRWKKWWEKKSTTEKRQKWQEDNRNRRTKLKGG
jgi:hypothetical protein